MGVRSLRKFGGDVLKRRECRSLYISRYLGFWKHSDRNSGNGVSNLTQHVTIGGLCIIIVSKFVVKVEMEQINLAESLCVEFRGFTVLGCSYS